MPSNLFIRLITAMILGASAVQTHAENPPSEQPDEFGIVHSEITSSSGTQEFELNWYTIDAGGGRSSDSSFDVHGTFGQTDVIVMVGEDFTLKGGFWPDIDITNIDDEIFRDGFEDELLLNR